MKNDRLFQIVNLLIRKKSITAPELAERFEVSVRTIYRDIETLSVSGIPIYTTPGKNGGIQIMEEYKLDRAMLTEEEQMLLLQSIQNLQMIGGGSNELWTKLSALFQKEIKPWITVDFTRWGGEEGEDKEKFEMLKHAIWVKRVVTIQYCGAQGTSQKREICPLQLLYKSKDWYVYAFCRYRKDYRIFKLNRIFSIEEKEEYFEDEFNSVWQTQESGWKLKMTHVKLLFKAKAGFRVFDDFAMKTIQIQENGDFLVEAEVPEGDWLYSYLLAYGEDVCVLEPPGVRQGVAQEALKVLRQYQLSEQKEQE